jgi:molybdate transport system ATP-binding protein
VFVTHRAPELLALADDCVVLEAGRVVEQGAPVDVLRRPRALAVASLVGIDNLLRLEVLAHDEAAGATWLGLGPLRLAGPLCADAVGSLISVGFYADDVLLALERPVGVSARNAIPCEVSTLHALGHDVVADLSIGPITLRARLTPGAVQELDLRAGSAVVALVKTAAIHRLG